MAHFIGRERAAIKAVIGHADLRLREEWGSSFDYTGVRDADKVATRIFIHISVTNPSNYKSNDAHARALEAIGRSRFPSTGVSYNRGCMINGSLYELQPIFRRGAHTVNDFRRSICSTSGCPGRGSNLTAPSWNLNVNSRAYVICQNVNDPVSSKQIDSLARAIVTDYRAGFITLGAARNPHGHRCVSSKSCPGNRMWAKMKELETKIKHYLTNGLPGQKEEEKEDEMTVANVRAGLKAALEEAADRSTPYGRQLGDAFRKINSVLHTPIPNRYLGGDNVLSPRNSWSYTHDHSATARFDLEGKVLPLLMEIKAAQGGKQRDEVLAEIQSDLATTKNLLNTLNNQVEDIREVVENYAAGTLNAEQVADQLMAQFHAATAPEEQED